MRLELPNISKAVGGRWNRWGLTDGQSDWPVTTHRLCAPFTLKAAWMSSLTSWGWRERHLAGLEWPYGTSCLLQPLIQGAFSPERKWVLNVKLYKDITRYDTIFSPLWFYLKLITVTVNALFIHVFLLLVSGSLLTNPWLFSKSLLKHLRNGFSHCFLSLEYLLSIHEKIIIVK